MAANPPFTTNRTSVYNHLLYCEAFMTSLWILFLFAVTILSYFFIGWVTIWLYYGIAYLLVLITNNDKYIMKLKGKEHLMWAWPIMLPFALLVLLFYVPYVTFLKLTPKEP